jgi:hypothetical protein
MQGRRFWVVMAVLVTRFFAGLAGLLSFLCVLAFRLELDQIDCLSSSCFRLICFSI